MDDGNGNQISLRDYIERVLNERDDRYEVRYRAQERALEEARKDMERRLVALNELRREVEQDRGQFVKRELFDVEVSGLKAFRSKAVAVGFGLALFSSIIGAFVAHLIGG